MENYDINSQQFREIMNNPNIPTGELVFYFYLTSLINEKGQIEKSINWIASQYRGGKGGKQMVSKYLISLEKKGLLKKIDSKEASRYVIQLTSFT